MLLETVTQLQAQFIQRISTEPHQRRRSRNNNSAPTAVLSRSVARKMSVVGDLGFQGLFIYFGRILVFSLELL